MSVKNIFAFKRENRGALYLLPTPIGNIKDFPLRCKEVLAEADIILCEDTRVSSSLFKQEGLDIKGDLISCYSQNEQAKGEQIIKRAVKEDLIIAYCSDAGTPGISDPGSLLCKMAIENDLPVISVPGPTAFILALISSGFDTSRFTFVGFLPTKSSSRIKELNKYSNASEVLIFYEAPHRMEETLNDLCKVFGEQRRVLIARELTKIYENRIYGTLKEVIDEELVFKGECVIIVDKSAKQIDFSDEDIIKLVKERLFEGESLSSACRNIAEEYSLRKNYVYKLCLFLSDDKK